MYENFELLHNYRTHELRREACRERLAQIALEHQKRINHLVMLLLTALR